MDRAALKRWANAHGEGTVVDTTDKALSLTSKLLRFRWNGAHAVGVGADLAGLVRIDASVPEAELGRYVLDLRSLTGGRAELTIAPDRVEVNPDHLVPA